MQDETGKRKNEGPPGTVDRGQRVEIVFRNTTMMSHRLALDGTSIRTVSTLGVSARRFPCQPCLAQLKSVHTGPGYECRNRAETGKISVHASGLAVDVASFELANGEILPIKPNGDEHLRGTLDAIRVAACGWFTTVLGPGSDAAHAEHLHVDTLQHGSSDRYRICQ